MVYLTFVVVQSCQSYSCAEVLSILILWCSPVNPTPVVKSCQSYSCGAVLSILLLWCSPVNPTPVVQSSQSYSCGAVLSILLLWWSPVNHTPRRSAIPDRENSEYSRRLCKLATDDLQNITWKYFVPIRIVTQNFPGSSWGEVTSWTCGFHRIHFPSPYNRYNRISSTESPSIYMTTFRASLTNLTARTSVGG